MRITLLGFLAAYFAVMGAFLILNVPILAAYSADIMKFCLLPLGLIGLCVIGYDKLRLRRRSEHH